MMTDEKKLRQEAERWFARLGAPDCSERERRAFAQWRQQSAAHAAAYEATERLLARVGELADREPRMEALMREARVPSTPLRETSKRWYGGWRLPVALAASLFVALMVGLSAGPGLLRETAAPVEYVSAQMRRAITLEDGSTIELDAASHLTVHFSGDSRVVELLRGRALFDVSSDADRPFSVRAGDGRVTALGTQFQVARDGEQTTVVLAEGRVVVKQGAGPAVAAREEYLQPGEQLVYSDDATLWEHRQTDLDVALSWSQGRLIFRAAPLADVVAEVNRYSSHKIVLADAGLATLPVHGNFVTGDASRVVAALEAVLPIRAERDGAQILLFEAP